MKLRAITLLILVAAILAGLAALFTRQKPLDVTAAVVERGRVEQTVSAILSGEIKPQQDALVSATYFGPVIDLALHIGDRVKQGDILLELDHAELDARLRLAQNALEAGQYQLDRARERKKNDNSKSIEHAAPETYAPLDGQIPSQLLDRLKQLQNAPTSAPVTNDLNLQLPPGLFDTPLATAVDVELAEIRLEQLQTSLDMVKTLRDRAFIRAPIDGMVANVFIDKGETVGIGIPVARIVNDAAFHVEAPFDESAAGVLQVGQPARIELDAYRGETIPAEVSAVAPVVSVNPDMSRTLTVTLAIEHPPERLLAGMSADVTVVTNSKDDALVIPAESLIRDEFVYVVQNGRARRRAVEPGMGNWKTREIVSGLKEGELVVTSVSNKALHDGVRVRVVERLIELE